MMVWEEAKYKFYKSLLSWMMVDVIQWIMNKKVQIELEQEKKLLIPDMGNIFVLNTFADSNFNHRIIINKLL